MQIFVDLDGVLADLDTHYKEVFGLEASKLLDNVDWALVRGVPGFFADIPLMPDARELWEFVSQFTPRPIILTGVPKLLFEEAAANKRGWVKHHLGEFVETRCCRSKDKSLHCAPGDLLIDDWERYKPRWLAKGGRWITHTSAADTIAQLRNLTNGKPRSLP